MSASDWNVPTHPICKHCGGAVSMRNPSGRCDHLYWPDNLTDEAKRANGYGDETATIEALRHMRDTTQSRDQYNRAVAALKAMGVSDE